MNPVKRLIPSSVRHRLVLVGHDITALIGQIAYFFVGKRVASAYEIPIYINNFNRLSCLRELIESLEKRGYHNIHIIDNNSSYQPLLDYYENCPYDVIRLKENVGYTSIWKTNIYRSCKRSYYVYTDSDVLPDQHCPSDFMQHFLDILKKYPTCHKTGFGLHTDDLPDSFAHKQQVIEHEKPFWDEPLSEGLFKAPIDTTFALYRPFCKGPAHPNKLAIRTGFPYLLHHQPWYTDSSNPTDEERYYLQSVSQSTMWSVLMKDQPS